MPERPPIAVAHRPEGPLLVFDGDCGFCRQWVARWRSITGDRVAYEPFQEAADRFPEVGRDRFARSVWLIAPDGTAVAGARAVFGLYAIAGELRWLVRLYDHLPGFAAATEAAYGLVARHREAAAFATRWLWGDVTQRPRYARMRAVLLRGLGVIYLSAFLSLIVQVDGLIGRRGILPAAEYFDAARRVLGPRAAGLLPSLLWLDTSDAAIHRLCWGGVAVSSLLIVGLVPGPCLVGLWVLYLSLVVAGQEFLSYQWDVLLLEAGLLAILLAPWGLWLRATGPEPSRLAVFLFRWLVFRLMFLSGVVKIASGDPAWAAWEALRHHYETQPLPTWTSWYAHHLPAGLHTASVGAMFAIELVFPWLVFAPRRPRLVAFWGLVMLQAAIAATGNYGPFNALSALLCVSLLEDRDLGRRDPVAPGPRPPRRIRAAIVATAAAVILPVSAAQVLDACRLPWPEPAPLAWLRETVEPLRSINPYGLFAIMTTTRPEIEVEASRDGQTWRTYRFRWKPGPLGRRPRFAPLHLPRLDWQMWFAALEPNCSRQAWFLRFEARLLEGSPDVLALLAEDPFPDGPPRLIRARRFLYRFSRPGSRDWWERDPAGFYCPTADRALLQ